MEKNTTEFEKLIESNELMESVFQGLSDDKESGIKTIAATLSLPDREFLEVSETIYREVEKQFNQVNNSLILAQTLNLSGLKVEDLNAAFAEICKKLDDNLKDTYPAMKINFIKKLVGCFVNAASSADGISKRMIKIPIELCNKDAKIPQYAHLGDAGMDVYALEDITVNPGETKIIPLGIKCALPLGYELQVRPRSGMSVKTPLRIANAPGTIDSNYRGEIGVIITNIEPPVKNMGDDGILYGQSYTITKGMRFAQLVLNEVPTCVFYEVDKITDISKGREEGYGSSGVS